MNLTAAVEQNLFETFTAFGAAGPDIILDRPELLRVATGVPFPVMNGVLRTNLEPAQLDGWIEETLAYFRERRLPFCWWVTPSTRPDELGPALLKRGFFGGAGERMPGMAVSLDALPDEDPATLDVEPVEDAAGLDDWVEALVRSYEMESIREPTTDFFRRLGCALPWRYYLVRVDGEPVACASMYLGAETAGIYCVGTVSDYRRRGLGRAVTLAPLLEARARGYRYGILQSTRMGRPVYEKLGFREYGTYTPYIFAE